jgi:branched-chain amino acid transport system substrate-binding protein
MKVSNWVAAIALAVGLAACGDKGSGEVTVGVGAPITGQYAAFGKQFQRGAEMAIADLNAAGGVLGKKLKLKIGDDSCDPKQAVAVANSMVSDKVPVVFGHYCSGSSIPASDVYAEGGVLQISPASTNPKLTDDPKKSTVFRVCGRDDQQGAVAGQFIAKHFAGKKIAIVHDKQAYSQGLAEETKKTLNAAGVQEVLFDTVTPGEKDYSSLVTKLKQAGVDVLYYGGYHTEAGLIVRQMRGQGMNTVLMGGDSMATNEFWGITGEGGEGTLFTFGPDPTTDPKNQAIVKKFVDAGFQPEGYTLYTYAAVQAWAQAATKAGTMDAAKVAEQLRAAPVETVMGQLGFDKKGDLTTPTYLIYTWTAGGWKPLPQS